MNAPTTRVHYGPGAKLPSRRFRAAVSLHRHTLHSEESLAPLPHYVRTIPLVWRVFQLLEERYQAVIGRPFDFGRAFWTPPLPAPAAFAGERDQMEDELDLAALVPLTDHDSILASTRLQLLGIAPDIPVSLEWTVPQPPSFLHLGIHNLQPPRAQEWARDLLGFTRNPSPADLQALPAGLHQCPGTLVVLNHPLWDEPRVGANAHLEIVQGFLRNHGRWIHPLELNGLRPWRENHAVLALGRERGYPVISGGDSHASAPNTVLNLTNAASFAEFASEVRRDRVSHILRTPRHRGPHALRYAECALDIVRDYPELAGRRRWVDRTYYREQDGSVVPLSAYVAETPAATGAWLLSLLRLCHSRPLRTALRMALAACQETPL